MGRAGDGSPSGLSERNLTVGKWKQGKTRLLFTSSTNRVKRVVVFKRPFFSSYTTGLWVRFLRFSLASHKKLEEDLEKLALRRRSSTCLRLLVTPAGFPLGKSEQR
jgi:hypothetical protein